MAIFPQFEWIEIDGRMVPSVKPQHYKKGSTTETELTGHDNPLPVANYTQNDSGLWLPTSKDNPVPTQLTGSIDEYALPIKIESSVVHYDEKFAEGVIVSPGSSTQLPTQLMTLGFKKCTITSYSEDLESHEQRISFLERDLSGRQINSSTTLVASRNYRTISGTFEVTSPAISIWIGNQSQQQRSYTVAYYLFQ